MLDNAHVSLTEPRPDWQTALRPGDVVRYRFPLAGKTERRPTLRPCLVLDVETLIGQRYAVLAPGIGADDDQVGSYDLRLAGEALEPVGLHRPIRFLGARRLVVPLENSGFGSAAISPILGRLDEAALERLHALRARLHAERDIAADRRAERRRRLRPMGRPQRPVTVEYRRPKRRSLRLGRSA